MRDSFAGLHPALTFSYFVCMIACSMLVMHPIAQAIALVGAFSYSVLVKGAKALKFSFIYLLPMLLIMAVMNPAFNHQGVTILFYLKSGNPVTLESILYGVAAAVMFITMILWFSCYNAVMTSDKFIYLFGKVIPALSLVLSMVLRFVPRYIEQIKAISHAQRCIGRDMTQGNLWSRAKNGINILSMMTTWALENGMETADSMKSRGYGLPGRTTFSIFRFDGRDGILLGIMGLLAAIMGAGIMSGTVSMRFFPSIKLAPVTVWSMAVYAAYALLCMLPVIINLQEAWKWKRIESKM
ncbi:energy-coupling factor transporter transmembrane component T [Paenibacillus paeoniae]|uniref:Energy-coupling factor transporter transmembrane protein EcfT n=1 Tax=Paenibacillus paeoniae TaxID=2292705 RepID=A0A371P5M6_9BACL|nr:energy-coupling factor transporter transmembrane component T [Paenibacillus paeoniae]REK71175.1 energy-coupling factor transporter transmembrane protein EcfT [Paenibacillus paeoniae]